MKRSILRIQYDEKLQLGELMGCLAMGVGGGGGSWVNLTKDDTGNIAS